jgi:hypothetical protein
MALVYSSFFLKPVHPLGNLSLLASQRRALPFNMILNGGFDDTSAWTLGSGCTISGSKLNATAAGLMCQQPVTYISGHTYQIDFDYTCTSGSKLRINLNVSNGANVVVTSGPLTTDGSTQHLTLTYTSNVTTDFTTIEADSAAFTGTIDSVSAKEVFATSNELSGASSLAFSPTATATGLGTLDGSSALTFADNGTLTGLGSVAGSSSLVLSPSGTATGLGSLIGSSTLVLAPSGTATGLGSLLGSSLLTFTPTGPVSGLGTLAGTASLSLSGAGSLTGLGSLLASTGLSFSVSGTVGTAGSNNIAGSAALTFSSSATLQGLGQLQGATQLSLTISGVLIAGGHPLFVPDRHPANVNFTPSAHPSETNVIGAVRPGKVSITNA